MDIVPKVRLRSAEGGEFKRLKGHQLQAHDPAPISSDELSTAESTFFYGSDEALSSCGKDTLAHVEDAIRRLILPELPPEVETTKREGKGLRNGHNHVGALLIKSQPNPSPHPAIEDQA